MFRPFKYQTVFRWLLYLKTKLFCRVFKRHSKNGLKSSIKYLTILRRAGVPGGVFPLRNDEHFRYFSFLCKSSSALFLSSSDCFILDFASVNSSSFVFGLDLGVEPRTLDLSNSLMSSVDWHLNKKPNYNFKNLFFLNLT